MDEDQTRIIDAEILRLKIELDRLENSQRRSRRCNHEKEIYTIGGRITGLKMAKLLLVKRDHNLIEQ